MGRMTNAEYLRQLRADAVAAGKCLVCRARVAATGVKLCDVCLQRQRTYQRTRRIAKGDGWNICCQSKGFHRSGCNWIDQEVAQ